MKDTRKNQNPIVHSDPEILGGTPVFVGTRVPLRNLIDYLEGGHSLNEFLDDFPSVSRDQPIVAPGCSPRTVLENFGTGGSQIGQLVARKPKLQRARNLPILRCVR